MNYSLIHGDVREVLAAFPDNSLDACLCDPPYGFRFMGKKWDYSVPQASTWREVLRVLKPGAPLLSFGGSRTYHRLVCEIEDAGFELCDMIEWIYGKGFPKPATTVDRLLDRAAGATREEVGTRTLSGNAAVSTKEKGGTFGVQVGTVPTKTVAVTAPATDLAKRWEGYGVALKPAHEPICMACKTYDGTIANNVARWGVGGLNLPETRIGAETVTVNAFDDGAKPFGGGAGHPYTSSSHQGRWPANLMFDEDASKALDEQTGIRPSTLTGRADPAKTHTNPGDNGGKSNYGGGNSHVYADTGGASRFFYSSKVSTKEREAGCEALPMRSSGECTDRKDGSAGLDSPNAGAGRTSGARNYHPTLKPISLTTYLAKLIRPPFDGAVLLAPFCGTGSEMIGALLGGWKSVIGIEQDVDYLRIARARLRHWVPTSEEVF